MRAWILDAPGPTERRPLRLVDLPPPVPAAGEVRIAVEVCGVCRTDLHVVRGELPVRVPRITPGHQVVGRVVETGPGVLAPAPGTRVGVAWLNATCGSCSFCRGGRENLCDGARFTGWTAPGGFAEELVAPAAFVYPLPAELEATAAAPLLCAGIIGYRALALAGLDERGNGWSGARLGIYGFGAAGHLAIQIARARGAEVFVMTRDRERHQQLARELGAVWVGDTYDAPPVTLDAGLVFAPAGEIVPAALAALGKGATLVLGGIHMSDLPAMPYRLLYGERVVRSVANNTRADGREFLAEAARIGLRTRTRVFRFEEAPAALDALERDAIRGAAVLRVGDGGGVGTG